MNDSYIVRPLGIIRTSHLGDKHPPIQPAVDESSLGEIELYPEYRAGLSDLEGFERIWVLFWMDRAKPCELKVVPYRDVVLRGLFATRAPSRPNPIGISPVKLLEIDIEAGRLKVAGADMLDRTPILDIKPYSPEFDAFPTAKAGWLDDVKVKRTGSDDRFMRPEDS